MYGELPSFGMALPTDANSRALALIKMAVKKFGRARLSGGNCGTFALALGLKLREEGFDPTLGFIYKCDVKMVRDNNSVIGKFIPVPSDTVEEVAELETDIYHVFLMLGDGFYDAVGKTTVNAIFNITEQQYGDHSAGDYSEVPLDDLAMLSIIEYDTNWSISTSLFREAMS